MLVALLAIVGPLAQSVHLRRLSTGITSPCRRTWPTVHWLGTDRLGRDLFVRTMHGVRISLLIGLLATFVSLLVGVTWGAIAGYVGGRTDEAMMRIVDVLYSLPYIFIVIILMTIFTRGNLYVLFVAIGAVGWLTMARIVRGQALVAEAEGVRRGGVRHRRGHAAACSRVTSCRTSIGPVVVYATLTIPQMILYESFLSFLGLGVQEPLASLGRLINQGAREMESAPWMLLVPAGIPGRAAASASTSSATACAMRSIRVSADAAPMLEIRDLGVSFATPGGEVAAVREFSLGGRGGRMRRASSANPARARARRCSP